MMSKTNMERACGLAALAAAGRTPTHQALRIARGLNKAYKRGLRDGLQTAILTPQEQSFCGIKLSQMTDSNWRDMQEYFTGRKPTPPFDAEKVRELLNSYAQHCYWWGATGHEFKHLKSEKRGFLREILAILSIE